MDDYEIALKHKYAQRFRKIRSAWNGLEIIELDSIATETNKKILFNLYWQVSDKQTVRLGNLTEDFLPLLKKSHSKELRIWLVKEKEKPVAFFSAWVHLFAFDMFYIGFDYQQNERLQLYFNILFFSVEQTLAFGKKKLILGRTALEAKARLGCAPKYLSTYLFIKNPLVRKVIFQLQQNISSKEGEWENRHPFKAN
jgi:predicted N-acyltransferase